MVYTYQYHVMQRRAFMQKRDSEGCDNYPLKPLGTFKTDQEARQACKDHHAKACKAAQKFGRAEPRALFF